MLNYFIAVVNNWKRETLKKEKILDCEILDFIIQSNVKDIVDNIKVEIKDKYPEEINVEEVLEDFEYQLDENNYGTQLIEMNQKEKDHFGVRFTHWLMIHITSDDETAVLLWPTNSTGQMLTVDGYRGETFHCLDYTEIENFEYKVLNHQII